MVAAPNGVHAAREAAAGREMGVWKDTGAAKRECGNQCRRAACCDSAALRRCIGAPRLLSQLPPVQNRGPAC